MNNENLPFNESSYGTDLIEIVGVNQIHLLSPEERLARQERFRLQKRQQQEQERLRTEAYRNRGQHTNGASHE